MIFSKAAPRAPTKSELTIVCGFLVESIDRLGELIQRVEEMEAESSAAEALASMREQKMALTAVADSIYPRGV